MPNVAWPSHPLQTGLQGPCHAGSDLAASVTCGLQSSQGLSFGMVLVPTLLSLTVWVCRDQAAPKQGGAPVPALRLQGPPAGWGGLSGAQGLPCPSGETRLLHAGGATNPVLESTLPCGHAGYKALHKPLRVRVSVIYPARLCSGGQAEATLLPGVCQVQKTVMRVEGQVPLPGLHCTACAVIRHLGEETVLIRTTAVLPLAMLGAPACFIFCTALC